MVYRKLGDGCGSERQLWLSVKWWWPERLKRTNCQSNGGGMNQTNASPTTQKFNWVAHVSDAKFCKPANYATAWSHSVDDTVEVACPSATATVTDCRSVPWLFRVTDLSTCATIHPQQDHGHGIKKKNWEIYIYNIIIIRYRNMCHPHCHLCFEK